MKWRNIYLGKVKAKNQMSAIKKYVDNLVRAEVLSLDALKVIEEINIVMDKYKMKKNV